MSAVNQPQATAKRASRPPLTPRSPTFRARNTNGGNFLPNIDARSHQARRLYDMTAQMVQDEGGADRVTETQLNLIRSFATLCVLKEALDAKVARGEPINTAHYAKLCSTQVRVAARISHRRAVRNADRAMSALRRRADAAKPVKRKPADLGPVAVPSPFGNIDPEGSIEPGAIDGS
jgi:hypothetical protein